MLLTSRLASRCLSHCCWTAAPFGTLGQRTNVRPQSVCQVMAAGPSCCSSGVHRLQAVAFAKAYVLEKGPIILEMDTYR